MFFLQKYKNLKEFRDEINILLHKNLILFIAYQQNNISFAASNIYGNTIKYHQLIQLFVSLLEQNESFYAPYLHKSPSVY